MRIFQFVANRFLRNDGLVETSNNWPQKFRGFGYGFCEILEAVSDAGIAVDDGLYFGFQTAEGIGDRSGIFGSGRKGAVDFFGNRLIACFSL